jgi:hypothetical protein
MTEYTVDKDGNVKSKGEGKEPLPTRYMKGDIPFTIPSALKKTKKLAKKAVELFKDKKIKPKPKPPKPIKPKPKPVRKAKGGMVIAPKSGSAHYTSKKNSKSIAKKYFKGSF